MLLAFSIFEVTFFISLDDNQWIIPLRSFGQFQCLTNLTAQKMKFSMKDFFSKFTEDTLHGKLHFLRSVYSFQRLKNNGSNGYSKLVEKKSLRKSLKTDILLH